jgi:putative PEP-CTERM system response regulator
MKTKGRVVVIDDEVNAASALETLLKEDGYDVARAHDGTSGLQLLEKTDPDVVLTDLRMPGMDGLQLLTRIKEIRPETMVVLMTAYGTVKTAVKAMKLGAEDYIGKPIDVEELEVILQRVIEKKRLLEEARLLRERLDHKYNLDNLVGESPEMLAAFKTIRQVAASNSSVLLLGESGTGKELFAQALHQNSPRRSKPFVRVACASLPETLLESELFGHEKGSFTGAHAQRRGRIETAHGGTLFLDEIGELPTALQVKLLRFLQDHKVERIGGRAAIAVDVRVITATNADLPKLLSEGRFREDLYYRIGVVTLSLPPLRDREDDVVLIAETFARRYAAEAGRKLTGFTRDAIAALRAHSWPGNVRELENRARRAAVMAEGPRITAADLELEKGATSARQGLRELRAGLERDTIKAALKRNRGNISQTATELGISRPTLYGLLSKFGIERQ